MSRPRSPNPTPHALCMREARDLEKCGIGRERLEYDRGLLRAKLVDTGQWTAEEFDDRTRLREHLQRLLEEAIENLSL